MGLISLVHYLWLSTLTRTHRITYIPIMLPVSPYGNMAFQWIFNVFLNSKVINKTPWHCGNFTICGYVPI